MTEELERKELVAVELKDAEKGEVEAIIATLGVVDRDGDIIRKGAIADGSVATMSDYGHGAMFGSRPVGKGVLETEGNKVVFRGKLFLDTADGRDTLGVLKGMGKDQQWSFGFETIGWERPSDAERTAGASRILTKLDAFEVSPVIRGAGIGTRTLAVKAAAKAADDAAQAASSAEEAARLAAQEAQAREAEQRAALEKEAQEEATRSAERASEEQKAAALRAEIAEIVDDFHRTQRTLKRMGVA